MRCVCLFVVAIWACWSLLVYEDAGITLLGGPMPPYVSILGVRQFATPRAQFGPMPSLASCCLLGVISYTYLRPAFGGCQGVGVQIWSGARGSGPATSKGALLPCAFDPIPC